MGSTVTMLRFAHDRVVIGNVGDSRGYRQRGGEITQITRDHSLLNQMIAAGMQPDAAFPWRHVITRALGMTEAMADVHSEMVRAGDVYLLCSDGLYEPLEPDEIAPHLDVSHGASGFTRKVAIKIIGAQYTDETHLQKMLIREAMIGGMLHHRNVVAVLGLGVDEGIYYLILEYVDGGDLDPYLRHGAVPEPLALHIAHEIALGLSHVHAMRDERACRSASSTATCARATCSSRPPATSSSATSASRSSPPSPEQLGGQLLTAATDQFSFAIALVELLTGRRPYPDANPLELVPIQRAGPNLDGIAEDLCAILSTALAIDPGERFASVEAMRIAIADAQATRPRCGVPEVAAWVSASAR
jgi:serine/threonine protein kinase